MKYKVGDRVRIKSIDWYNENKDEDGDVPCNCNILFLAENKKYLGTTQIVERVYICEGQYVGNYIYKLKGIENTDWTDEMIEGLVERNGKTYPYKIGDRVVLKGNHRCATITDLKYNSSGNLSYYIKIDNDTNISIDCPTDLLLPYNNMIEELVEEESANYSKVIDNGVSSPIIAKTSSATIDTDKGFYSYSDSDDNLEMEWNLPQGYQFKDENSNIINATKIVLEKKPDDKLKLESTKKVREYWSEYARIYIEIYDNEPNECVLTHLYTLEGHRQKGYGRQALIEAELIAKELGCHTAYIKVETNSWMHEWYLRRGYKWYKTADEGYTWLTKNLTSIDAKKKQYPKTYEECSVINGCEGRISLSIIGKFTRLINARNAYWRIAGQEMGLERPWKPDWTIQKLPKYCIAGVEGQIKTVERYIVNTILAFPTAEMRDAFYEVFREEIEICKELL